MSKITAMAKVHVTIEIQTSVWGEDCSIGQLYKQASEDALNKLHNAFTAERPILKIVGEPKVIGVITEKES